VLFLNAAYRDGTVERPYPRWIAQSLRFAVPLTVIVAATALYALVVRSHHYGLSVERVWAFIVAGAALMYAVGYSAAAFRPGQWLAMASQVNVMVALALVVVIGAGLTPLLSPYRLSANSQYHLILDGRYVSLMHGRPGGGPFNYLAFESGRYGRVQLERLAALQGGPDAQQIRSLAAQTLKSKYAGQPVATADSKALVARLPLYPAGRTLDPQLSQRLAVDWNRYNSWIGPANVTQTRAGVFVDLDGDGSEEFVLLSAGGGPVYQNRGGTWQLAGQLFPDGKMAPWNTLAKAMADGSISAAPPAWKDLALGSHHYRLTPQRY
jgi:hypothetical protein